MVHFWSLFILHARWKGMGKPCPILLWNLSIFPSTEIKFLCYLIMPILMPFRIHCSLSWTLKAWDFGVFWTQCLTFTRIKLRKNFLWREKKREQSCKLSKVNYFSTTFLHEHNASWVTDFWQHFLYFNSHICYFDLFLLKKKHFSFHFDKKIMQHFLPRGKLWKNTLF